MKLVIGLGNIGKKYMKSRHNIGFICVDNFAERYKLKYRTSNDYYYTTYQECVLLKPKTFMNRCGLAYQAALDRFGQFPDVLAILDDIDLPLGTIRIRTCGGDGGHKGLRSILESADDRNVLRIRIGVGRQNNIGVAEFVLDNFTADELDIVNKAVVVVTEFISVFIEQGVEKLLDEYSKWKKTYSSKDVGIVSPKEEEND